MGIKGLSSPSFFRQVVNKCLPALLVSCCALVATSWAYSEETEQNAPEIDRLVQQLGSPAYVERESASRRLAAYGVAARDALMVAIQSNDEEVRHRSRSLLLKILDEDLNLRIDQFTSSSDQGTESQLPGWHAYRELVGDTPDNRRLFVEIIRAEPLLMEALESGPREATEGLRIRCDALQQEMQQPQFFKNGQQQHRISIGTVAAFFLIASDERVAIDDNIGRIVQTTLYQSSFQIDINSGPRSEPLRRMLGRWIVRNRTTTMAYQGLHFAMQYNLKEGRELARHLIESGGQPANLLQTALLVLGRFGSPADMDIVKPLLDDKNPVQFGVNPQGFQQEVRDIALAVAVHLTGQELRDYGFNQAQSNPQMLYNPGTLIFTSAETRDAAFRKWDAWQAKNAKDATEQPAKG